jgi:hypothetical protein
MPAGLTKTAHEYRKCIFVVPYHKLGLFLARFGGWDLPFARRRSSILVDSGASFFAGAQVGRDIGEERGDGEAEEVAGDVDACGVPGAIGTAEPALSDGAARCLHVAAHAERGPTDGGVFKFEGARH